MHRGTLPFAVLLPCALVVICTAIAVMVPAGAAGIANPGAHGFSVMLYAVSLASNNNGSAFGGLSANTPFWNVLLGVCMFLARFPLAIAMLAMAGSLAAKRHVPESAGTLSTHTPLFVTLLACVVIVVGALTFLPALALGPIAEQLMSLAKAAGGRDNITVLVLAVQAGTAPTLWDRIRQCVRRHTISMTISKENSHA